MAERMNLPLWVPVPSARVLALGTAVSIGLAGAAAAEPASSTSTGSPLLTIDGQVARRVAVDTPVERYTTPHALASPTIYLERCIGGCRVHAGDNDARSYTSTIPRKAEPIIVREFANSMGQVGVNANAEWAMVVACVQEVYSPFAVRVTDQRPTSGGYHMAIIAGGPGDIGLSSDILGVAPLANDCRAIDNVISFSFANQHVKTSDVTANIRNVCWTAAQESAHAFGLDHEYSFLSWRVTPSQSACNDPMTYRTDCGGEKFFRNELARCGETSNRACKCGALQNSHLKVLSVFGTSTPSTGNPTAVLQGPVAGASIAAGQIVQIDAGGQRGVSHVDLYLNGYKWIDQTGARFGAGGQPNPGRYSIAIPAELPNSIVDIQAIAYDDLGTSTETEVVTVTKGAPCASASTCARGQKCEAGKCFWDPPTAEVGASCPYNQFCKSGLCTDTADGQICTQNCIPEVTSSCPDGFACVMSSDTTGVCFPADGAGCCSIGGDGATWWVHIGLGTLALGLVTRRRRR
jgi:MYXO-CTERM domain-containing protein